MTKEKNLIAWCCMDCEENFYLEKNITQQKTAPHGEGDSKGFFHTTSIIKG